MTYPPQDDDRDGGTRPQSGAWPPQPGPVQPPRPEPGSQYGQAWQPPYGAPPPQPPGPPPGWGQPPYGRPPHAQPPYAQPPYAQPQYGQPPYGQPPYDQPTRKSRAGLIAALAGVAVLVVVGGLALAFLLRSQVLDPRAVERDVAAQFEEREGVAIDLECTERMEVDSGATYECSGVTADEEPVTLRIAITDEENAAYTWTEP